MKALTFVAVLTALATFAIARAEEQKPDAKAVKKGSKAVCKAGADERIVEVQSREGGGCKVVYTVGKNEAKTVGEAEHQLDFCDQLLERMIKKFEGSGYKCN